MKVDSRSPEGGPDVCVKRSVTRVETHEATDEKLKKSPSKMAKDLENITSKA